MSFILTTAIRKIIKMRARIKVIPGGSSAGKTYGILPVLIDRACKESGLEISVVSESIPHLRRGALKDFLKIMKSTGRYVDAHYNRTLLTYTFANGSYVEFFSADDEVKVRGPRRNILYINEANNLKFETYYQLAIRTSKDVYLDFNPSNEFWAHTELKEGTEEVEWLTLTYKDNEALQATIVKMIEQAKVKAFHNPDLIEDKLFEESNIKNTYWSNWWKVYGLGKLGALEGVVFDNWDLVESIPANAKKIGTGLDFGFSNHPSAGVDVYEFNGEIYLDELIYETGLTNPAIADKLKSAGVRSFDNVYADAAEPKSIAEIKARGINIIAAKKGPDSIRFGIDLLQGVKMNVTRNSTNLIKELRGYIWEVDKSGKKTGKPVDANNHAIDALRYVAIMKLGTQREFSISIT